MNSKFVANNPNEIKNDVIGDTKTVLQLMDESRLKVSNLKETLDDLMTKKDRLQITEHELKKSIINSTAHIDITADSKSYIENYNTVFFKTAQQTQSQNHLLTQELIFCDDSYDKIEEALKLFKENHSKNKEYNMKQKKYNCNELKELEECIKAGKVKSLSECNELNDFKNSIGGVQKEIQCKLKVIEEKNYQQTQIHELMKNLEDFEIEMEAGIQLTTKLHNDKEKSLASITNTIENLNKLKQAENSEITNINYEENFKTLEEGKTRYNDSESLFNNLKTNLEEIEVKILNSNKRLVDNDKEKEEEIKQSNTLIENYKKTLSQINCAISNTDLEIENQETKLKDLELRINSVFAYLNDLNAKPKIDQQEIINVKEKVLEEFKIRRDQLKDEIARKQESIDNEVIDIKKVIEVLQADLQKPQNDYEKGKEEIGGLSSIKNTLSFEKDNKQKQIDALEGRNKILTRDFEACKELKATPRVPKKGIGSVVQCTTAGQRAENNIRSESRKSISRKCWDSDSSIEAVDLANRMRMRKMRRIERESIKK